MNIGLFFGTFNPIHIGHLIIANYMAQRPELDQVWFVVTPQNPHKQKDTLLKDQYRLDMVREAIQDNPKLRVSDIEFKLAKPNYTISTLSHLQDQYPEHQFALILGEDNLRSFQSWHNWEQIIAKHSLFIYPRNKTDNEKTTAIQNNLLQHPSIHFCEEVPVIGISASQIRARLKANQDCRYLLSDSVYEYLLARNYYH
ncbi:MAG: hypothetical protein RLZZ301_757 [Bacteroidota bacterium]|jgi:nicotinate-nucleotide adenylyltransferase